MTPMEELRRECAALRDGYEALLKEEASSERYDGMVDAFSLVIRRIDRMTEARRND